MLERPQPDATRPRASDRNIGLEELVELFWHHYAQRGAPLRSTVGRLADHALAPDRDAARRGTRLLFERIVEPLSDGFTLRGAETYRRAFAQIITEARRRPQCKALDQALTRAGLDSERALRRQPVPPRFDAGSRRRVRAVLVLSRLTLGADVAISLPVLRRAKAQFPGASIGFVGTDASAVITRSVPGARHIAVPYERTAFLADRLNAWEALAEAVRSTCAGLSPSEYVLIDTDSRLTQLGLMRPLPALSYVRFPSRSYDAHSTDSLGVLVRRWLNETLGGGLEPAVGLYVAERDAEWVRLLRARGGEPGPFVSVSFGVGGNQGKRAGLGFEAELLERLVRRGWRVLLARGAGTREIDESHRLCRRLIQRGLTVRHVQNGPSHELSEAQADVTTWEGTVETFVATIAGADAFIGYDSAGQHIAAALGVPTLSIFIEAAGARHATRWTPHGAGAVKVVRTPWPADQRRLLGRAESALLELTERRRERR